MKIAGVDTGTNKGDVKELDETAKAAAAARDAVGKDPQFAGTSVTLENLQIKSVTAAAAGAKLRGLFANRSYRASGSARFWPRDHATDTVSEPKLQEFEVVFHDTLDEYGMPELAVDSFTVS